VGTVKESIEGQPSGDQELSVEPSFAHFALILNNERRGQPDLREEEEKRKKRKGRRSKKRVG